MNLELLPTPAALVDLDILAANSSRMVERTARLGVRLRPHVKTHKCVEAAHLQLGGGLGGITVSTLAEARLFAAGGFRDILYAVPVAPQRLTEAAALARQLHRLTLLVDHEATVAEVEKCARAQGLVSPVMIKLDCGSHRCGVDPQREESVRLAARVAASKDLELRGVLAHAGHAYACRSSAEVAAVACQERDVAVGFAARLRAADVDAIEVSIGSTPTVCAASTLAGVTEVRPGNYAFYDAFQAAIGSCALDDCAFTVLATVVGCYPERSALVVDAGALALSRDDGPRHVDPACGHGVVRSASRQRPLPGLSLVSLSQEHGTVRVDPPAAAAAFPPGTRLRIVPNHACLAAACFDRYSVTRGDEVVDEWRPCRGW